MKRSSKSYNRLWFVFLLVFLIAILSINNCLSEISLTKLNQPKVSFRNGTALVWDYDDYIYALVGGNNRGDSRKGFYRYSISEDVWDVRPQIKWHSLGVKIKLHFTAPVRVNCLTTISTLCQV